jgi:tetratricopeptide (TPR) repeat protein
VKQRRAAAFFAASSLLSGCGGAPAEPARPQDTVLQRASEAGNLAFTLQRPSEAASQYERALERAEARDDAAAIGDYGYDLAVADLAANRPKNALAAVRMTRIELASRGAAPFPALVLAEATALYRLGERKQADSLATDAEAGSDPAAAAGAAFLRGLIADESDDHGGLDAALARLAHPANLEESADAFELAARRDILGGMFVRAKSEAARAADLRRTCLDYRGMARARAVEGKAAEEEGDTETAANLYIQAAQSAAAQGDASSARPWLRQALALANTPTVRNLVRQTLAELDTEKDGPAQRSQR